jgi:polycomb protein EED
MWHGDLIFSKADAELSIVLWSIDGFDSKLPPPEPAAAPAIPVPLRDTRSAFSPVTSELMGYTSHLKLGVPDSTYMFTRFSIYPGSKTHNPILSFLNSKSQIFFWDLSRFREYYDVIDSLPGGDSNTNSNSNFQSQTPSQHPPEVGIRKHPFLQPFQHRIHRGSGRPSLNHNHMRDSPAESTNGSNASDTYEPSRTGKVDWVRGREIWKDKYDMSDAYSLVEPHQTVPIKPIEMLGRQMAWSRDGKWCVAVGSWGQMVLLGRWEDR